MLNSKKLIRCLAVVLALSLLTGCAKMWQLQSDFNAASRIAMEHELGITTIQGKETADSIFHGIVDTMDKSFMDNVNPRLKQNAYTILAYSHYRLKQWDAATATTIEGLALDEEKYEKHPRDTALMIMMPALVFFGRTLDTVKTNKIISHGEYGVEVDRDWNMNIPSKQGLRGEFKAYIGVFDSALSIPNLSDGVKDYIRYCKWAALATWSTVITVVRYVDVEKEGLTTGVDKMVEKPKDFDKTLRAFIKNDVKKREVLGMSLEQAKCETGKELSKLSPFLTLMGCSRY